MYISTDNWNKHCQSWNKISRSFHLQNSKEVISFIKIACAIRSNLIAGYNLNVVKKKEITFFNSCWNSWISLLKQSGYSIFPEKIGNVNSSTGKIIYCCSPRAKEEKKFLIVPSVKYQNTEILPSVMTIVYPTNKSFPSGHAASSYSVYWRGILGEIDLLMIHVRMQPNLCCTIESIFKNEIIKVDGYRQKIIDEIKRRKATFEKAIATDSSSYSLATNYWRLEECFWSLYHDDRPVGYSFLDILRKRIQDWRGFLMRKHKMMIRDFTPHKDSLGAINSLVEGIILQKHENLPPGKVIRQLRPALIIHENNVKRTLKGRVTCT